MVWKIILSSEQPLVDRLYMVDAQSGQVIYKFNRLTDITGDGNAYPTYPGLSSVIDELFYHLNGNGYLQGQWAYIKNDSTSVATSSSNSFLYSPSSPHFDEANLYWHIDQYRAGYINNMDNGYLSTNGLTDIKAHAHTPIPIINNTPSPNAWFSPSDQQIYFNAAYPSVGTKDFAKDDKVIYHEYTHAVIYYINSGIESTNDEEGGISEGTPDYFAGAYTNRSKIGEYCCAAVNGVRDMANPTIKNYDDYKNRYDYPSVEAHVGGEFFSSVLWALRSNINFTTADGLVYDALFRITSTPSFLSFRDAMTASDDAYFGGVDDNAILNTFANKGIFSESISGPTSLNSGQQGIWQVTPTPTGSYNYQWYYWDSTTNSWNADGTNSDTYSHTFFYSGAGLKTELIKVYVSNGKGTNSTTYSVAVQTNCTTCQQ